jgi:hypothetical protein
MVCATSTSDGGAERGLCGAAGLASFSVFKGISSFQPHRDANIEERCIEWKDLHAYIS